jgi:hypothetical protein
MAVFMSIDPALRARDYLHCHALDMRTELTDGLHESNDSAVLQQVRQTWQTLVKRATLPWPAVVPGPG